MESKPRAKTTARGAANRRPQLSDVAAAAGVSIVTVSRAMNSPAIVSTKTHKLIESAIAATGYVPDLVARSMAQQRTRVVAGFVPTLLDSIFANSIQGLSDSLSNAGLELLLGNTQYDLDLEERLITAVLGRRPDAVALTGTAHNPGLRRTLRRAGIPVVEMWSISDSPIDMAVGLVNRNAAREVTTHLIERGYRRIGFVSRPVAGNDRAADRRQGYLDAMHDAGYVVPPEWMWETETTLESGRTTISELALAQKLDAIQFSGDNTAAGAFLTCLERGIRVPKSLAIAGFGDLPIANALPGGLTTVRIDAYEIGRRAGALIVQAMNGERPRSRTVDIGFELVVRGST